jgi:hypothetical protein
MSSLKPGKSSLEAGPLKPTPPDIAPRNGLNPQFRTDMHQRNRWMLGRDGVVFLLDCLVSRLPSVTKKMR